MGWFREISHLAKSRNARVPGSVRRGQVIINPQKNRIMKASTTNQARGAGNVAAGKTRQAVGKVVRSPKLQAKGIVQEAGGRIQRAVGKRQEARGD